MLAEHVQKMTAERQALSDELQYLRGSLDKLRGTSHPSMVGAVLRRAGLTRAARAGRAAAARARQDQADPGPLRHQGQARRPRTRRFAAPSRATGARPSRSHAACCAVHCAGSASSSTSLAPGAADCRTGWDRHRPERACKTPRAAKAAEQAFACRCQEAAGASAAQAQHEEDRVPVRGHRGMRRCGWNQAMPPSKGTE